MKQKKNLLLVLLLILVVAVVGVIVVVVNNSGGVAEEAITTNEADDDGWVRGLEVDGYTVPSFYPQSSDLVLPAMKERALEWADDAMILHFNSVALSIRKEGSTIYYGHSAGKFASWSMYVYSPSMNKDAFIDWRNGEVSLSNENVVEDFLVPGRLDSPVYNDVEQIVSSTEVYQTALDNGLDLEGNYINMIMGLETENEYGDQYVWGVQALSKTIPDQYAPSIGQVMQLIFVDAVSGEFLSAK